MRRMYRLSEPLLRSAKRTLPKANARHLENHPIPNPQSPLPFRKSPNPPTTPKVPNHHLPISNFFYYLA